MAIFINGPHTVSVYLEEEVLDSRGNATRRPSATPVVVTGCLMHPVASTRGAFNAIDSRFGQRVDAAWKLVCAVDVPIKWWSRVEWTAAGGAPEELMKFTILGGPLRRHITTATAHISCTLQEAR